MEIYYIRWPNGEHTIAVANSRAELWDLLDEEADAVKALLTHCDDEARLAFDIIVKSEVPDVLEYSLRYESTQQLLIDCLALSDDELTPGTKFFHGVTDPLLPEGSTDG